MDLSNSLLLALLYSSRDLSRMLTKASHVPPRFPHCGFHQVGHYHICPKILNMHRHVGPRMVVLQILHRMQTNIIRPLYNLLKFTELGELQLGHL